MLMTNDIAYRVDNKYLQHIYLIKIIDIQSNNKNSLVQFTFLKIWQRFWRTL